GAHGRPELVVPQGRSGGPGPFGGDSGPAGCRESRSRRDVPRNRHQARLRRSSRPQRRQRTEGIAAFRCAKGREKRPFAERKATMAKEKFIRPRAKRGANELS